MRTAEEGRGWRNKTGLLRDNTATKEDKKRLNTQEIKPLHSVSALVHLKSKERLTCR